MDSRDPPAPNDAKRLPNGRFGPNRSGNPKGRPPKPRVNVDDLVLQILDEKIPAQIAGSSGHISMREALIRSVIGKGIKDANIALKILQFEMLIRTRLATQQLPEETAEVEDAIIRRFGERQVRQMLQNEADTPSSSSLLERKGE